MSAGGGDGGVTTEQLETRDPYLCKLKLLDIFNRTLGHCQAVLVARKPDVLTRRGDIIQPCYWQ